jgi:hypothetical protein
MTDTSCLARTSSNYPQLLYIYIHIWYVYVYIYVSLFSSSGVITCHKLDFSSIVSPRFRGQEAPLLRWCEFPALSEVLEVSCKAQLHPFLVGRPKKNGKRYKSLDILKNKWHSMTMWPWDIPYECKLCVVWWFLEYQGIYVTVYVHHAVHICRYLQCASTRSPRHLSTSLTEPNSQSSMTFVWQALWVKWSRFNMTQPHPTWVWGHTPITIYVMFSRKNIQLLSVGFCNRSIQHMDMVSYSGHLLEALIFWVRTRFLAWNQSIESQMILYNVK